MFAIAFDLVVADLKGKHPRGVAQAYSEVAKTLEKHGFKGIQGSVYVTEDEDMANLMRAILSLKTLPWFPASVRDIRAFRIENWSDFTRFVKDETM